MPINADSKQLDAAISAAQEGSASAEDSTAGPSDVPNTVPVRKLDNEPLVEPPTTDSEIIKDFGGKFYPTEVHPDELGDDSEKLA